MDDYSRVRPTVLNSPLDPTRARPQPWFVGDGRGLMIGVVTLCAILLLLRIASFIWLVEEAWSWWVRTARPELSSRQMEPLPDVPGDIMTRPLSASPLNGGQVFSADDYPYEALRRNEEGRVVARLAIDAQGHVTGCTVIDGSGSTSLDGATCARATRRLRFTPVRSAAGAAVPARYDLSVRWTLED